MKAFATKNYRMFYDLFDAVMSANLYLPYQSIISAEGARQALKQQETLLHDKIKAYMKTQKGA